MFGFYLGVVEEFLCVFLMVFSVVGRKEKVYRGFVNKLEVGRFVFRF